MPPQVQVQAATIFYILYFNIRGPTDGIIQTQHTTFHRRNFCICGARGQMTDDGTMTNDDTHTHKQTQPEQTAQRATDRPAQQNTAAHSNEGTMKITCVLVALVMSVCSVGAFVPCPSAGVMSNHRAVGTSSATSTTEAAAATRQTGGVGALSMGWGDALGKAFANEEMGASKNPGLKNAPNTCMVRLGSVSKIKGKSRVMSTAVP